MPRPTSKTLPCGGYDRLSGGLGELVRLSHLDSVAAALLGAVERRIGGLESEIAALHATLCDASLYQRAPAEIEKAKLRLPAAESELEAAFARWMEIEERAAQSGREG